MIDITEGLELPGREFHIRREDLIKYAGASGDFNVIHWNDRVAQEVGLPDVIAHGMLTMGLAIQIVTDWLDDPGRLRGYGVRFTRPVVVPDDDVGATLHVAAKVTKVEVGLATITITATCADATVLGKASATVAVD